MSRIDHFFKQAKAQGYLARSAYKLLEIQKRHRVIPQGGTVLDLGCSPGAWLQVAIESAASLVVGIDLKECSVPVKLPMQQVEIKQTDVRRLNASSLRQQYKGFHTVLSDMCHNTTGIPSADVALSLGLAREAARLALSEAGSSDCHSSEWGTGGLLLPNGSLVVKVLQGQGCPELHAQLKPLFNRMAWVQPKASRTESREMFLVACGRMPH